MMSEMIKRCERLIDACSDAVEQLDSDQPERVVRQRIERGADRQHGERDEKNRPASPFVRIAPDKNRDRQHDPLRGDHAERHHGGRFLRELKRQFLPDQRQKRSVGEVKKERAKSENHQRTGLKKNAIARGEPLRFAIMWPSLSPDRD